MRVRVVALLCLFLVNVSACAQEKPASSVVAAPRATPAWLAGSADHHRPHAGMLRRPDVSRTHITFAYANDLWVVPREGGTAAPLTSPPGPDVFPRFSPDGETIAFSANYDGNSDLYTIPLTGGVPRRVTHHPSLEFLCDWTPDGKLLFHFNGLASLRRHNQLFTVSPEGGLPSKLPVPYGTHGAISPDGQWLAYTPYTRDYATWKRYRGGMASDIWLFNLQNRTSRKITDWEGTDSQPMWQGQTLYYMSDAGPEHRLNIWSYDIASGKRKQITHLRDYDVKWPAIGPGPAGKGEIVFQNGPDLYLLDLETEQSRAVEVLIPGDRPTIRPKSVDASKFLTGWDISSSGKRAVVEARGDIWTIPAKKGSPRNLTRTSGSAERDPSWSPDGRWIAYFSDETGEYELYITQSDGKGETRQLTSDGKVFRYNPTWSPDSKYITFTDKTGAMYLHVIESAETKLIDTEPWASPERMNWSHDSAWIAYTKSGDNHVRSVWLYQVESGEKHQVMAGMFNDTWPTFDRKGDYLFLASQRNFTSPAYEDIGTTFIYANTDMLLVVPLRDEVGSPWAPKSDEEEWDEDEDEDDEESDEAGGEKEDDDEDNDNDDEEADDQDEPKDSGKEDADKDDKDGEEKEDEEEEEPGPVIIELDGFEQRAIPLPVKRGGFTHLAVNHEGKLIYARRPPQGSDDKPSIKIFDLTDEEKKEKTVLEGIGGFAMSADGEKLLVRKDDGTMAIVDAAPDQKLDKPMSLSNMAAVIDPPAEWRQIFAEAWRIQRDFFYDPNMHGVDWEAMRERYGRMLDDCICRQDISYVIGEMIAELNVGHAYVLSGGDTEKRREVPVGMLGVDFELHDGAYRIARIYEGAVWDYDARGPLSRPGVDVKEGDYLLAVNGVPLDTSKDPWAAFQGLTGRAVTLTVSDKPAMDEDAREVVVEPADSEANLRYRAWVEKNRAHVEQKSDGRVGYIHVPDTATNGQNELFRQFYGQRDKAALIIDERWNGGGRSPLRFVELLNRPRANYWAVRNGNDWAWPPDSHQGPKCMLINGPAGSGGDAFPYYFRQAGLGKLIGMRTWGGLVGISGNPRLIDGGYISAPTFAFYETDGTWGVEGHGIEPDIEVIDDPALMVDGGDPQLEAAIERMLKELEDKPYTPPKRPAYPDRSGMGIREQDR